MLNSIVNFGSFVHSTIKELLEIVCRFSHWGLVLFVILVLSFILISRSDIKISLYKIIVRLERSKMILLILFSVTLLYSLMIYRFTYHLSFFMSFYYSLLQFFAGVAHPSSLGLSGLHESWELIYIGGFFSLLTTALLIILKFFKTWVYDSVRVKIVNEDDPHVIMCGFGVNNRHIVDSILKIGKKKIIVLEKDTDNPYIQDYREKGVVFILGDTTQDENLKRAGVNTCEFIIVSAGHDNINLAISKKIENIMSNNKKVYIHLENHLLERNFKDTFPSIFEVFSYNENAARRLFYEKQLDMGVDTVNTNKQVHLVVVGFGGLGVSVVINAIKLGHFYNQKNLKITIIDNDESTYGKFEAYYDIENIKDINIEFKNYGVHSKKFLDEVILNVIDATYIIFSLANDNDTIVAASSMLFNLKQSNKLNKKTRQLPVIAVRLMNDSNLELEKDIFVFGKNSEISDIKYIQNSSLDAKAKESYEQYRNLYIDKKLNTWDELPDSQKDKNRAVADNRSIRENTIDLLDLTTLKSLYENADKSLDRKYEDYSESMKKLIDMEKRRWNAYHIIEGWKNESSEKIIKEWEKSYKNKYEEYKIHICIVETKDLESIGSKQNKNYFRNDWNQWRDLILKRMKDV